MESMKEIYGTSQKMTLCQFVAKVTDQNFKIELNFESQFDIEKFLNLLSDIEKEVFLTYEWILKRKIFKPIN